MTPTTRPHIPDALAVHLLATVAGPRLRASPPSWPPTADLRAALADAFGPAPATPSAPTDADLARAALCLAADTPATGTAIEALLEHGAPPTYGVVETTLAITFALAILQTELTIDRAPTGKYRIKLHKRAASDPLLKALAHAIMRALGAPDGKTPRLTE